MANEMKSAGWAIWCEDQGNFHRLDGIVRLFSDEMFAKSYLSGMVPSRVACDRVVQVEIRVVKEAMAVRVVPPSGRRRKWRVVGRNCEWICDSESIANFIAGRITRGEAPGFAARDMRLGKTV